MPAKRRLRLVAVVGAMVAVTSVSTIVLLTVCSQYYGYDRLGTVAGPINKFPFRGPSNAKFYDVHLLPGSAEVPLEQLEGRISVANEQGSVTWWRTFDASTLKRTGKRSVDHSSLTAYSLVWTGAKGLDAGFSDAIMPGESLSIHISFSNVIPTGAEVRLNYRQSVLDHLRERW